MALSVFPITPDFVAEVGDVDLSSRLTASELEAIRAAFRRYAVLIFPAQSLSEEAHLDFGSHFGPLEATLRDARSRVRTGLTDLANLDSDGNLWSADNKLRLMLDGNRLWHTDSSFKEPTAYASLLYARSIAPIGGLTEYADLRAAYDALNSP